MFPKRNEENYIRGMKYRIRFDRLSPPLCGLTAGMVRRAFDRYVAADYPEKGVESFYRFSSPQAILSRCRDGQHRGLVAIHGDRIVGFLEIRLPNHITSLFVDPDYHRMGIARKLWEMVIGHFTEVKVFTVNSSPYAVKVYEKFHFVRVGDFLQKDGIYYLPMRWERP